MITPLRIPGRHHARLTRHVEQRLVERDIPAEEIASVLASAWRIVEAIDGWAGGRGEPGP